MKRQFVSELFLMEDWISSNATVVAETLTRFVSLVCGDGAGGDTESPAIKQGSFDAVSGVSRALISTLQGKLHATPPHAPPRRWCSSRPRGGRCTRTQAKPHTTM